MKIRISGRSEDITGGMKSRAEAKVQKLLRFYDRITWVDVVLSVDRERHRAEISAGLNRGTTVVGKAESDSMTGAIDQAADKIARQLRKHKAKLAGRRPPRAEPTPEPASED